MRSGKSTLAHKISKRLSCPEISVDWLRSVVLPYLYDKDKVVIENILFPGEGTSKESPNSDEAGILWPAVNSFIEDRGRWRSDFVLDGIHLLPKYLTRIGEKQKQNVRVIILVKTSPEKVLEGFNQVRIRQNDWLLKKHWDDKEYLKQAAHDIATRGRYFESEAVKYGFQVVNTEDDFEAKLNAIADRIYAEKQALKAKERQARIIHSS